MPLIIKLMIKLIFKKFMANPHFPRILFMKNRSKNIKLGNIMSLTLKINIFWKDKQIKKQE